jgi:hypothetical protein
MCVCAFDNAPDRNLEIVVAALAERFSLMKSCGMPECAAALSARWYRKNDGQDAELATDAADRGFSSKLPRLTGRSTKKQQSGSPNGMRIGGNVMVHRTDFAGGSIGQTWPGHGKCRHGANGPSSKTIFARTSAGRQELHLLITATSADRAIHPESLALESSGLEPFTPLRY